MDTAIYTDVKTHYDKFIDDMQLSGNEAVLEIGVGTGRLAIKVCGICREFYGIDISAKTIEAAKTKRKPLKNI